MRDKCVEKSENANTMRDKLIELLQKRSCFYAKCINRCSECDGIPINDDDIGKIADYLIANDAKVPLYGVGDTVYYHVLMLDKIDKFKIVNRREGRRQYVYEIRDESGLLQLFADEASLHHTLEEAERALKNGEPICDYTKTDWNDYCECSAKDHCDTYNERSETVGDLLGEVIGEIKNEG